jgi:hypothetical protein
VFVRVRTMSVTAAWRLRRGRAPAPSGRSRPASR